MQNSPSREDKSQRGVILLFTIVFIGIISYFITQSLIATQKQTTMLQERQFLLQLNHLILDANTMLKLDKNACAAIDVLPLEFDGNTINIEPCIPQTLESELASRGAMDVNLFVNLYNEKQTALASSNTTMTPAMLDEYVLTPYLERTNDIDLIKSFDMPMCYSPSNATCILQITGELDGFDFTLRFSTKGKNADIEELYFDYSPL